MNIKLTLLPVLLLLCAADIKAQERPIGYWRSHMPYNTAVSITTDGTTIFAASEQSFFTYNAAQNEISTYSKVEGMSDVGISMVDHDSLTGQTIIIYTNTNIDLFRNETFFNIPDIKLRSITGVKRINNIYTEGGSAYLSTSFGIVVVNLDKKEIKETYTFTINNETIEIKALTATSTTLYAVTTAGVYKANKNSPNLQAFSSWTKISPRTNFLNIVSAENNILVSTTDSVYSLDNNDVFTFRHASTSAITNIDPYGGGFRIAEARVVRILNSNYQVIDTFNTYGQPNGTATLADSSIWVADLFNGVVKRTGNTTDGWVVPDGPAAATTFDILPYNGELWIAHGSHGDTWTIPFNRAGISQYKDGKWKAYNYKTVEELDGATDFISLAKDPADGTIYAGSYRSGLFIVKPDGTYQVVKEGVLEPSIGDASNYRVTGVTFDQGGNLWVTQALAPHDLVVKTAEGQYIKHAGPATAGYTAYPVIDDYNQKWYVTPGNGIAVYNDNSTPENASDDSYRKISTAVVSNNTNTIVKDRDGSIWLGTTDGIGIINCPGQMIDDPCPIDRPIVQYDQFAGYLFQGENVKAIAVDGANRKWVGTMNGIWLISPDGDKVISRFTAESSPLPSNAIQRIAIDPVTGDVYIGTSQGLVSYRGTATDGGESSQSVTTFPNPVPSGYSGTIAIRGVSENADVKITDISGQLVYRTQAYGGQAVWDGRDYTGRRPQSGVYLIFISNKDGSQTYAGKMVFME